MQTHQCHINNKVIATGQVSNLATTFVVEELAMTCLLVTITTPLHILFYIENFKFLLGFGLIIFYHGLYITIERELPSFFFPDGQKHLDRQFRRSMKFPLLSIFT